MRIFEADVFSVHCSVRLTIALSDLLFYYITDSSLHFVEITYVYFSRAREKKLIPERSSCGQKSESSLFKWRSMILRTISTLWAVQHTNSSSEYTWYIYEIFMAQWICHCRCGCACVSEWMNEQEYVCLYLCLLVCFLSEICLNRFRGVQMCSCTIFTAEKIKNQR